MYILVYCRNKEAEREKALLRYHRNEAKLTAEAKKERQARKDTTEELALKAARLARLSVRGPRLPRFKIGPETNLETTLTAAWKRIPLSPDKFDCRQECQARFEEVCELIDGSGWPECKDVIEARGAKLKALVVESEKLSKEAWRREPVGSLWKQTEVLLGVVRRLDDAYDEMLIWLNDGGPNQLRRIHQAKDLLWQTRFRSGS